MDSNDLKARIKEDGVKFLSLQFTDVIGTVKSVDIPAHRVGDAMEDGVWFDGSSVEGFARMAHSRSAWLQDERRQYRAGSGARDSDETGTTETTSGDWTRIGRACG